jgi:hypothetical protein
MLSLRCFVVHSELKLFGGSGELSSFDHLLAVVPCTTGVGGREGDLDSRYDDSGKETSGCLISEKASNGEGGDDDDGTGGDHLGKRGLGGDGNAFLVVGCLSIHDVGELSLDFTDHVFSGSSDGSHGESGECIRDHSSEEESSECVGVKDVNGDGGDRFICGGFGLLEFFNTGDESTEKGEGDEAG